MEGSSFYAGRHVQSSSGGHLFICVVLCEMPTALSFSAMRCSSLFLLVGVLVVACAARAVSATRVVGAVASAAAAPVVVELSVNGNEAVAHISSTFLSVTMDAEQSTCKQSLLCCAGTPTGAHKTHSAPCLPLGSTLMCCCCSLGVRVCFFSFLVYVVPHHWNGLNFSDPRLLPMARALSPCVMRIGGTAEDGLTYIFDQDEADGQQQQQQQLQPEQDSSPLRKDGGVAIEMLLSDFDRMSQFVNDAGWKVRACAFFVSMCVSRGFLRVLAVRNEGH
jgi:hypothetical protein